MFKSTLHISRGHAYRISYSKCFRRLFNVETFKGCVRYIFTSLFCMSKREDLCETRKNVFYFISKALFVLEINFKFSDIRAVLIESVHRVCKNIWFLYGCMLRFHVCFAFMFADMFPFIWYKTCSSSEHSKIEFHFKRLKNGIT